MVGFLTPAPLDPSFTSRWQVADPNSGFFGELIPDAALGDKASCVIRDDLGFERVDGA